MGEERQDAVSDKGLENPRTDESYFETEGHFSLVEMSWLREIILSFTE